MSEQDENTPNKVEQEKSVEHPMEEVFDVEPGTTLKPYEETQPPVLVDHHQYDEKDDEIEQKFDNLYYKALDAFEAQSELSEQVEGKYSARNAEVAAQFLNTALSAAKEQSTMKQHKDKITSQPAGGGEGGGGPVTNNNVIIEDRNTLLRNILGDAAQDETQKQHNVYDVDEGDQQDET